MAKKLLPVKYAVEVIEKRIYIVRGQRVMLDEDLAAMYEVGTKVINQAMKRHPERFPEDFAFQLTQQEFVDLRSQIVTSNVSRGGRRYMPWAFTEQGVAMLSSVLRSPKAISLNIEIMRAFIRLRRLLATPGELIAQLRQLSEMVNVHDHRIEAITKVIQDMLKPRDPPRGRIGFQGPEPTKPTKESS